MTSVPRTDSAESSESPLTRYSLSPATASALSPVTGDEALGSTQPPRPQTMVGLPPTFFSLWLLVCVVSFGSIVATSSRDVVPYCLGIYV